MALDMNPEVRTQWCAALRSGDYPQGRNRLRSELPDGMLTYCCLGVLTDLAVAAGVTTWEQESTLDLLSGNGYYLSDAVMNWAGLGGHNPRITVGDASRTASDWNDDAAGGLPFPALADAIEGDSGA